MVKGTFQVDLIFFSLGIPFEKTKHFSISEIAIAKAQSWLSSSGGRSSDISSNFTILSPRWILSNFNGTRAVTSVAVGSRVTAQVEIKADKRFGSTVTLEVRQDRFLLTDISFATQSFRLVMQPGETETLSLIFVADGGLTVNGYFMTVSWSGGKWEMPPQQYPPGLSLR